MIHSNAKLVLRLAALVALLTLVALVLSIAPTQAGPPFISQSHAYVGSVGDDWIGEERLVATGTTIIEKVTYPAGGIGFQFTNNIPGGPTPFNLDDGQRQTFKDVAVGTYTVTESDPTAIPGGYRLTNVACVETGINNSFGTVGTRRATIKLEAGETVTCTFTNRVIVVGGIVVPVNKLELLAPWMGLVALLAALAAGAAFVSKTNPL